MCDNDKDKLADDMPKTRDTSTKDSQARTVEVLVAGALSSFSRVIDAAVSKGHESQDSLDAVLECTSWITAIFDACALEDLTADAPDAEWKIKTITTEINRAGEKQTSESICKVFASSESEAIETLKQHSEPTLTRKYSYQVMSGNNE